MEQILTRRFTMEEVAYALMKAFPAEFFNGKNTSVATDMRLFDLDNNGVKTDSEVCLMKDQMYNAKRRLEVSWSQSDTIKRI